MRYLFLTSALLILFSCQQNESEQASKQKSSPLPEIPQVVDSENFDRPVQNQFNRQYKYIKLFENNKNQKYAYAVGKLGKIFQAYSKYSDAIDCYIIAINYDVANFEWLYLLAFSYKHTNQDDLAIKYYKKALTLQFYIPAIIHLAKIYSDRNEMLKAKKLYQSVLKNTPKHPMALYGLALINRAENQPQKAIKNLLIILNQQPQAFNINYQLGQLFAQLNKTEEAQKYLEKVKDTKHGKIEIIYSDALIKDVSDLQVSSQKYATQGLKALSFKHYNKAIRLLKKAIAANNERIDTKYNLAIAYFNLKQYDKAQELLEIIAAKDSKHYLSLFMHAKIKLINKEYQQAEEFYNKTIAINATLPDAYAGLAQTQHLIGKYKQAIDNFKHSLVLNPNQNFLRLKLFRCLFQLQDKNNFDVSFINHSQFSASMNQVKQNLIARRTLFLQSPNDLIVQPLFKTSNVMALETKAMFSAFGKHFKQALLYQQQALDLAKNENDIERIKNRIEIYKHKKNLNKMWLPLEPLR